jgi:hypothetical protein
MNTLGYFTERLLDQNEDAQALKVLCMEFEVFLKEKIKEVEKVTFPGMKNRLSDRCRPVSGSQIYSFSLMKCLASASFSAVFMPLKSYQAYLPGASPSFPVIFKYISAISVAMRTVPSREPAAFLMRSLRYPSISN